jgi:hypothetical protein
MNVVVANRGSLFVVALRHLRQAPPPKTENIPFITLAMAHLADLQAQGTPPKDWEELDLCLAIRLRLTGLNAQNLTELIQLIAPLSRSREEGLPSDLNQYAKKIAHWAFNETERVALLKEMAPQWQSLARPALDAIHSRVSEGQAPRKGEQELSRINQPKEVHEKHIQAKEESNVETRANDRPPEHPPLIR